MKSIYKIKKMDGGFYYKFNLFNLLKKKQRSIDQFASQMWAIIFVKVK